jgi:parallel beta-helix repeat protein
MSNLEVTFISTPIGELSSYSNVTNSSGQATVLLRSTQSGVANILASVSTISNSTNVSFKLIPAAILIQTFPYDIPWPYYYARVCRNSLVKAIVLDNAGNPVGDIPVNFSTNSSGASLSPKSDITTQDGTVITYLQPTAVEVVKIRGSAYIAELGQYISNSTNTEIVGCQDCDAPTKGDWIIDTNVTCKDANITLDIGNLNVTRKGKLTFFNVSLSSTTSGMGINLQNGGKFYIYDKDNNSQTDNDKSRIQMTYFYVQKNTTFVMNNSEVRGTVTWYCPTPGTCYPEGGFVIYTKGAVIQNSNITGSCVGIVLDPNANNTILNGNSISDNYALIGYGCGVGIQVLSSNNTISDNYIARNGFEGIEMAYGYNNTVRNNTFIGNAYRVTNGLDFWVALSPGSNISDNLVIGSGTYPEISMYGIYVEYSPGITIHNNTVYGQSMSGIILLNSSNAEVSNNTVSGFMRTSSTCSCNWDGLVLGSLIICSSPNSNITANRVSKSNNAICLFSSDNSSITANMLAPETAFGEGNSSGIYIQDSSNNTINNNTVTGSFYTSYLISLSNSLNNTIRENSLSGSSMYSSTTGIIFDNSNGTAMLNNFSWMPTGVSCSDSAPILIGNVFLSVPDPLDGCPPQQE